MGCDDGGQDLGVWAEISSHRGHLQDAMANIKESLAATRQLMAHDSGYQIAQAEHVDRLLTLAELPLLPADKGRSMFREAIQSLPPSRRRTRQF